MKPESYLIVCQLLKNMVGNQQGSNGRLFIPDLYGSKFD